MPVNRVIYNQEAIFIGPAPSSGNHWINSSGHLVNDLTFGGNVNLIRPIQRATSYSYDFNFDRTEIKALGHYGNLDLPTINPPSVNLNFTYLQNSVLNELRMGFYANYLRTSSGLGSGQAFYDNNFAVCCLSGFITRDLSINTDVWPYNYRDKRNIFIAHNKNGEDLNNIYSGLATKYDDMDVFAFGDCYLTNYRAAAAVGELPQVSVSYVAENLVYYSSGSGNTIPALNPINKNEYSSTKFVIPSTFEGSGLVSALSPGDMTFDIYSRPRISGLNAINGTGQGARGNLIDYSEHWGGWSTSANINVTGDAAYNPNGIKTADRLYVNTLTSSSSSFRALPYLESGKIYEFSVWIKTGDATTGASIGIYNSPVSTWLNLVHFRLPTFASVTSAGAGNNSLSSGSNGWYKCSIEATVPSGSDVYRAYVYPNTTSHQNTGHYIDIWGAQVRDTDWENDYVYTSGAAVSGQSKTTDLKDIGVSFSNLNLTNYNLDLNINRRPLQSLTAKLPLDRKVTFPVYVNLNCSIVVNNNQTGSLARLFSNDDDYYCTVKLKNPAFKTSGTAVQYDFRRAKLSSVDYGIQIGGNKVVNLGFVTEINPSNLERGFFISGLLNTPEQNVFRELLQTEDGEALLFENGDVFDLYNSVLLY